MKLGLIFACALGALALAPFALADERGPIVVAYSAPTECPSDEAFMALLEGQLARLRSSDRPWRFEVKIARTEAGDYEGTLTSATAERVLRAATCDDLAAALTLVIAVATPEPVPPPAVVLAAPPVAAAAPVEVPVLLLPGALPVDSLAPERDMLVAPKEESSTEWRVGARVQDWTNGAWLSAIGPTVAGSVEPHWGRYRMMFEVAAGMLQTNFGAAATSNAASITWGVLDLQICPLDLDLGAGFAAIGCTRTAGAVNHTNYDGTQEMSGAFWVGGGARLRWQSPWRVFVEGHANGLWGTQSTPLSGSPGWMDFGGTLGMRI